MSWCVGQTDLWCLPSPCGVDVSVCALCGEVELTRYAYWCKCVQIWEWRARPFFGGRWSRCGCHRSESHPATMLTCWGIICTFWEYLVYPYYPCVMVFGYWSFDSIICDPSSVVHLSDCDQALACTSNRTLYWCSLSFFSSHPSLALSLSLFLLFSSLSCSLSLSLSPLLIPLLLSLSLSLSVNVGVHIVCMYIAEVIGAVEYERSFTHCALHWSFCLKSPWVLMTVLSDYSAHTIYAGIPKIK